MRRVCEWECASVLTGYWLDRHAGGKVISFLVPRTIAAKHRISCVLLLLGLCGGSSGHCLVSSTSNKQNMQKWERNRTNYAIEWILYYSVFIQWAVRAALKSELIVYENVCSSSRPRFFSISPSLCLSRILSLVLSLSLIPFLFLPLLLFFRMHECCCTEVHCM